MRKKMGHQTTTNALLILTIANHACWSTLHVSARYLQVYAEPVTFDGQGVLSSTKGCAAVFLWLLSVVNARIESSSIREKNEGEQTVRDDRSPSLSQASAGEALSASASCLNDLHDEDSDEQCDAGDASVKRQQQPALTESDEGSAQHSALRRQQIIYTIAFAVVATTRASSNVASAAFTYPYNITLIASLTPVIIAIFDRFLLKSPFPPLLWPTIFLSGLGSLFIAISQSIDSDDEDGKTISTTDNLIGCGLQLISAVFSAFARILMKRTEGILTPTHIVQTNNVANCILPFLYTMIHNPSSWKAFRYLLFNPKSLLAWCAISLGVYSFASTLQIRLVRQLGPGFYSSWVAVRVLGSMILSTFILGEGIQSWLEWIGVAIMIVTVSVYLVRTQNWMEERKEQQESAESSADVEETDGNEELVPVSKEKRPLLDGAGKGLPSV